VSENAFVQKRESIYQVLPPPLVSSAGLGWKNVVVERHSLLPCESSEVPIIHHVVEFACGPHVSYGERPNWSGRLMPYSKRPGNINLFSDGIRPAIRSYSQTELIFCGLHPDLVREAAGELNIDQLRGRLDVRDESVGSLMRLLETEANLGGSFNSLYVDHLAYALTSRLFSLAENRIGTHIPKGALPLPRLRRVVERMRADLCTALDLKTLAAESGYSRNHFLRMFRAATESTPHQYLLRLRIERAQSLMKKKSLRIIDIAESCGFASQAQFSRVFKQVLGVTPSRYRREIW
jgi:AraC family transcriptional regulator